MSITRIGMDWFWHPFGAQWCLLFRPTYWVFAYHGWNIEWYFGPIGFWECQGGG